jgi:hypothetical protein
MLQSFPDIPSLKTILERLPFIFPEGTENRRYLIREMAAKIIFVMFYTGAVEGHDRWIRPDQVTKMTDAQAKLTDISERLKWYNDSLSPGRLKDIPNRWYAVNTREPIRDESLRMGLVQIGAVIERDGLPTTSSKPRYALKHEFAELFSESFSGSSLETAIENWQKEFLSASALARVKLQKRGLLAAKSDDLVLVTLPNGETRRMAPGPSSILCKSVMEVFAKKFLRKPALIFLSESGNKVVAQDNELAASLGLNIEADKNLPDIIMADIGPSQAILLFIEVVATDGPVSKIRKESLLEMALNAGFERKRILFLTAFQDRGAGIFRRLSSDLAWGSLVWFDTEPDHIVIFSNRSEPPLEDLLDFSY